MNRHFVLPDCQVKDGVPLDHLRWAGNYVAKKKPDTIICIGDFADMESLCSYDVGKKSFEGRRYKTDIEIAKEGMAMFMAPIWAEQERLRKNKEKIWKPRQVLTLGNHEDRINRAVELDPKLEGMLSVKDLEYEKFGWEVFPFLKAEIIDGIAYSHYFPSGVLGRPINSARMLLVKNHMSCVAGHLQGRDIAYSKRADGTLMFGLIAGSFYQHNENYLSPQTNQHWRGVYMLHEVKDGSCDEMAISLNFLRNRYGD